MSDHDPLSNATGIIQKLKKTSNPFHKHILNTFLRRLILEVIGRAEEMLEMATDDVKFSATLITPIAFSLSGKEKALEALSTLKQDFRCFIKDETIMVSDDGIFHSYEFHHILSGEQLIQKLHREKDQNDKPFKKDSFYERSARYNHFLKFTADGRIKEETNGQCGPDNYVETTIDAHPTREEVVNALEPLLKEIPTWSVYSQ